MSTNWGRWPASPVKSIKRGVGETQISVKFAGIVFEPGQFIYVDADGILVSKQWLLADAVK